MKNSNLKDLLKRIDIKKYIEQNLSKPYMVKEVKKILSANDLNIYDEEITPYIIEQFIKEQFSVKVNPNKDNRKDNYWVAAETQSNDQIGFEDLGINLEQAVAQNYILSETDKPNPRPTKEIDLLEKAPADIKEPKASENSITLDFINKSMENNVQTILKSIDHLRTEVRKIKRINSNLASPESQELNRALVEEIMRVLGSESKIYSISINTNLLQKLKDLLSKEYGIKDDMDKIINAALVLAVYKCK